MTDVEQLLAIEEIKRLKAKYFYYLDTRDWERWRAEVWAEDASLDIPEAQSEPVVGADAIVKWTSMVIANQVSSHHGHMPIIDILTPDTAKAIWAMEDTLRVAKGQTAPGGYNFLHGFGHYHETYVRLPVGWRIKTSRVTRLHVELI